MGHDKTIKQGILQRYIETRLFEKRFLRDEKEGERINGGHMLNAASWND